MWMYGGDGVGRQEIGTNGEEIELLLLLLLYSNNDKILGMC